jgi:hypothetical protein
MSRDLKSPSCCRVGDTRPHRLHPHSTKSLWLIIVVDLRLFASACNETAIFFTISSSVLLERIVAYLQMQLTKVVIN